MRKGERQHTLHLGLDATKPVFGVSGKLVSNQSPQLQILARKMRFRAQKIYI